MCWRSKASDILVLGCTHYPFLRDTIQRIAGADVTLIDPAEAVARELVRRLSEAHTLRDTTTTAQGKVRFFTSGDVPQVQAVVSHLWGDACTVEPLVSA